MERHESERRLTPCAEFPNDNQDLHHGSVWAWVDLCDVPVCELPRTLSRPADPVAKVRDPGPLPDRAPFTPAPALQVVSLLTILEGVPRDAGAGRGENATAEPMAIAAAVRDTAPTAEDVADEPALIAEDVADEPAPIAEAVVDTAPGDVAEPPLEAVPAEPPQIVSLLTTCEAPPAEAVASPLLVANSPTSRDLDGQFREDDEGEAIEVVDELSFDGEVDEGPGEDLSFAEEVDEGPGEETPATDPFAQLVSALSGVARGLGAGEAVVASLDGLLGQARFDGRALDERTAESLVAGEVVVRGTMGFARSPTFTAKVLAWRGILSGESEDFALPDGGALEPLDEWAADLLARLVGPPARADGVRRDLRRRGVAAFGLVADAA
jgi:hypothetical protein